VLPEVTVGAGSKIKKAIIDRGCQIPEGTVIGYNHDDDRARGFRVSENGVVLVTKTELENL
jgi:glucose-1-phosphate adenylyltransferase